METAAGNEGGATGAFIGAGMGVGMGLGVGAQAGQMMGQMNQSGPPTTPPTPPDNPFASSPPSQFHIHLNGQKMGPYPLETLKQGVASGQFTRETMVWREGMAQWAAAGSVPELSGFFGPPPFPGGEPGGPPPFPGT